MKKITKITLLVTAFLIVLAGCSSNNSTSSSETAETTQSSEEVKAETVSFFATGEYKEGADIQSGSYYVVLTDVRHASSDEEHMAYVSVYVKDSAGTTQFSEGIIKEIGKPYRVTIEKGDRIIFDDNYSPTGWNVKFFTDEDYEEYQASEKK